MNRLQDNQEPSRSNPIKVNQTDLNNLNEVKWKVFQSIRAHPCPLVRQSSLGDGGSVVRRIKPLAMPLPAAESCLK
jgi:hypothetical protein